MGTKMAPNNTNLFIGHLDQHLISHYPTRPTLCLCYIDNIFCISPGNPVEAENFVNYVNLQHPTIKWDHYLRDKLVSSDIHPTQPPTKEASDPVTNPTVKPCPQTRSTYTVTLSSNGRSKPPPIPKALTYTSLNAINAACNM